MNRKTRSLLEELEAMHIERDKRQVIENRANNIITSAVRLIEQIEASYDSEAAEILTKKLFNAIKMKDTGKFARAVRRLDETKKKQRSDDS